jgi:hypothetical protein
MDLRAFINQLFDRGDDPYNLYGKRDDTMDMVMTLRDYYQSESPDRLMGAPGEPPAPPKQEKKSADVLWEKFQQMNPNLDYDKVAQQSGGNVPGGSFSDMRNSPGVPTVKEATKGASDEEFMQWVKDFTQEQEFQRKNDPRSRAYDPQGAELILANRAAEQAAAQDLIYAKARQTEAELAQKAYDYQFSTGGRIDAMMNAISGDEMLQMENPQVYSTLLRAKQLQLSGDEAGAEQLLNEALSMMGQVQRQTPPQRKQGGDIKEQQLQMVLGG